MGSTITVSTFLTPYASGCFSSEVLKAANGTYQKADSSGTTTLGTSGFWWAKNMFSSGSGTKLYPLSQSTLWCMKY